VKIKDSISSKQLVDSGVPLGINTWLFTVFNLCQYAAKCCQIYLYADDAVIISHDKNINTAVHMLQEDYNKILPWSHDHGLVINNLKTKLMHIKSPYNKGNAPITIKSHFCTCLE
jgi:hypothetical protein